MREGKKRGRRKEGKEDKLLRIKEFCEWLQSITCSQGKVEGKGGKGDEKGTIVQTPSKGEKKSFSHNVCRIFYVV